MMYTKRLSFKERELVRKSYKFVRKGSAPYGELRVITIRI